MRTPEDKVCADCKGILKWYLCSDGTGFYFHRSLRDWVIKDHKPNPLPSFASKEDK